MADVVVVEDIFADWTSRGIGTADELRSPALRLALNTAHAGLGIDSVIIELDPPEITIDLREDHGPRVGYLTVSLERLAAAVRQLAEQHAKLAPGRSD